MGLGRDEERRPLRACPVASARALLEKRSKAISMLEHYLLTISAFDASS